MEKPYILHMFTPARNLSPFDVNMALDAGWGAVPPYISVEAADVTGLVQDAIFSRGPKGVRRTGIFIGGRDMNLAMDMLDLARAAMVPPFEVSVFADPSGAFTTAAALVAVVEHHLAQSFGLGLEGVKVLILGGTGPVGAAAAVIAAKAGAEVTILSRRIDRAAEVAELCNHRYGSDITGIHGDINDHLPELIEGVDVVMNTARAGIEVLGPELLARARRLKVAADVNAVPPAGIVGVGPMDDGVPLPGAPGGAVAVGALAIGNIKYQVQRRLLVRMRESEQPQYLHYEQAFEVARDYVRKP